MGFPSAGLPPPPPPPVPQGGGGGAIDPEGVPPGLAPGTSAVKTRDLLYRLIVSQLFYDGYQAVAVQLTNLLQTEPACPPSDRLFHVVTMGLEREAENRHRPLTAPEKVLGPGLDLEYETDVASSAPEPATYETAYVTSHKGNCRAGAFSPDGGLCATGSVDASIKVLDVDRMLAKSSHDQGKGVADQGPGGHPVIRTLYDHTQEVSWFTMTLKMFFFFRISF